MQSLIRALTAASAACLLAPAAALAADGEQTPLDLEASDRAAEQVSGGGGLVRTIVGLAVVIGVIYGLHWILKQVRASRQDRAAGGGLSTLATLPLGTNRSLHLVRTGDEVVLVGAGEGGVTPIRTYTIPEARALGLLAEDDDDGGGADAGAPAGAAFGRPEPDEAGRAFGGGGLRRLLDAVRRRTVI